MHQPPTANTTIYIRLLEEGTPCSRPTQAVPLAAGTYRVLPTIDYDPTDEVWEFVPGSTVHCESFDGQNIVISSLGAHAVVGKPSLESPSILAYASTKGPLETLVKNWAVIFGTRGIRVNAVAPGVIDTDMSNFTKTEDGRKLVLGIQALKRIGRAEDVADVVAFLASDAAR
jgi:NAD(P)-dependent dehydrogenase (short-subunit alcohol dehydrogenase family)